MRPFFFYRKRVSPFSFHQIQTQTQVHEANIHEDNHKHPQNDQRG